MAHRNVIVGGGPAGIQALETLRALSPRSEITLISDEPAYARMALPYWLAQEIPERQLLTGGPEYFARMRVDARIGDRVAAIHAAENRLELTSGESLEYDQLLLASGSRPRSFPVPGSDLPGVTSLWTLADAREALTTLGPETEVCLIGAGFIGFIVLNALYKRGCRLSVVEAAPHVLPRMLDREAAGLVETWLSGRGVGLFSGTSVERIAEAGGRKRIELRDSRTLLADLVIVATGILPNVELASVAGLTVLDGIVVNRRCQTSVPNIYAAGDCAAGPDLLTGEPAVHAIQPTAVDHGRIAGANMAGRRVEYSGSLLMNVLEVAGLQCSSFGQWNAEHLENDRIGGPEAGSLRRFVWAGTRLVGAVFVGPAGDVGMTNDVGMVKGLIQTRTDLGEWRGYVREHPADIRRPYMALGVPQKLLHRTTLGGPSREREYRHDDARPKSDPGPHHGAFLGRD